MSTGSGVRELHERACDKYGHGRSTGTGKCVPYERQRAFSGNFTMARTVYKKNKNFLKKKKSNGVGMAQKGQKQEGMSWVEVFVVCGLCCVYMYICIRRHGSDGYLGMSLVQNGGFYLMC